MRNRKIHYNNYSWIMSSIKCSMCDFSAPTRGLWLSHLRAVHNEDDNFNITCGIDNCWNSYTRCASFVSHVYRQHREVILVQRSNFGSSNNDSSSSFEVEDDGGVHEYNDDCENSNEDFELQHAVNQLLEIDQDVQKKKGALFILNLKEVRCLSEASIEHIVKETQKMFKHTVGHIQAGVNECIARNGSNPDDVPNLTQFFRNIEHPFHGLQSVYLRESFYREKLGCSVSDNFITIRL